MKLLAVSLLFLSLSTPGFAHHEPIIGGGGPSGDSFNYVGKLRAYEGSNVAFRLPGGLSVASYRLAMESGCSLMSSAPYYARTSVPAKYVGHAFYGGGSVYYEVDVDPTHGGAPVSDIYFMVRCGKLSGWIQDVVPVDLYVKWAR